MKSATRAVVAKERTNLTTIAELIVDILHITTRIFLQPGNLDWSRDVQGLILSGQSYGSIVTTFMGGYLANRYSAKLVIGGGMGGLVVLTLISPIVAELSPYLFFAVQILKGGTGVS